VPSLTTEARYEDLQELRAPLTLGISCEAPSWPCLGSCIPLFGRSPRSYGRCVPSSLARSRSKVPSGRWPAFRATSSTRHSEKLTAGLLRYCCKAAATPSAGGDDRRGAPAVVPAASQAVAWGAVLPLEADRQIQCRFLCPGSRFGHRGGRRPANPPDPLFQRGRNPKPWRPSVSVQRGDLWNMISQQMGGERVVAKRMVCSMLRNTGMRRRKAIWV